MGQGLECIDLKTLCATHNSGYKMMDSSGEYVMGCNWMKIIKTTRQPNTLFMPDWELLTWIARKKEYKH
jgi:hypothetical protein